MNHHEETNEEEVPVSPEEILRVRNEMVQTIKQMRPETVIMYFKMVSGYDNRKAVQMIRYMKTFIDTPHLIEWNQPGPFAPLFPAESDNHGSSGQYNLDSII